LYRCSSGQHCTQPVAQHLRVHSDHQRLDSVPFRGPHDPVRDHLVLEDKRLQVPDALLVRAEHLQGHRG
jgi:hypothetical protein